MPALRPTCRRVSAAVRQRQSVVPPSAAGAAAAAASEEWLCATGVPLLNQMAQCGSLERAAVLAGRAGLLTVAAALLGRYLLRLLDSMVSCQPSPSAPGSSDGGAIGGGGSGAILGGMPRALLSSLLHQAQRLLPLWGAAYTATVACAFLLVAAERPPHFLSLPLGSDTGAVALAGLHTLTQFLQDASEEAGILLIAFTLLEFKNRVVAHVQSCLMSSVDRTSNDATGLVAVMGTLVGLAIWGTAGMVTLANYGVNLRPLIASLGASSLVVGIAAQSMLRNVAAGVTLYATRPFSLGDRVVLWTSGGMVVVEGVVAALHPTRTVIARTLHDGDAGASHVDAALTEGAAEGGAATGYHGGSTFYINNGDIVENMIVENRSRAPPPLPGPGGGASGGHPAVLALDSLLD